MGPELEGRLLPKTQLKPLGASPLSRTVALHGWQAFAKRPWDQQPGHVSPIAVMLIPAA